MLILLTLFNLKGIQSRFFIHYIHSRLHNLYCCTSDDSYICLKASIIIMCCVFMTLTLSFFSNREHTRTHSRQDFTSAT